jgi:Protein of unknown function (DUF3352)
MISDSVPAQTPSIEPGEGATSTTRLPRRWLLPVIAAVILLAAAIGVVAGLTLNGPRSGGSATVAGYVPAEATIYYELRLDLPGDQRANLRTFLGHFPGVDADKYLTDEIDKQLDAWASKIPGGYLYSADVKPWFDGTLAFATIGVPSMLGVGSGGASPAPPQTMVFAGVRDAAGATALSDRLRVEIVKAGGTVTSTTHGSATIWSATGLPATGTTSLAKETFAWTITSDEVIGGTSADLVTTALDVHAGSKPSLADRQEFRDGLSRLPADHVLVVSVNVAQMLAGAKQELSTLQPGAGDALDELVAQSPNYVVTSASVLGDRLSLDASALMATGATLPANRDRGLVDLAPGDAIFFDDGADVGKGLTAYVNAIKKAVATNPQAAQQLQQAEAILGGDLGSFVSWIGDAALVAGQTNGQPYAGLIITPTDAGAARTKLAQLRGLLQLAAGVGTQVSVTDADHNGTTITTVKVNAGAGTPAWAATYQYAVTNQRVVFGNGETFVARVLDIDRAHSLGGQARFSGALDAMGGTANIGTVWLDLAALRAAIEPLIPAAGQSTYQSDVRPWVAPFDYLIAANRADGQLLTSRVAIVVK